MNDSSEGSGRLSNHNFSDDNHKKNGGHGNFVNNRGDQNEGRRKKKLIRKFCR